MNTNQNLLTGSDEANRPSPANKTGIRPRRINSGHKHTMNSYYTKRAWIRRQDVPAGQPATGHYDCECGRKIQAGFYGQGPDLKCECGLVYSNTGWIQNRKEFPR